MNDRDKKLLELELSLTNPSPEVLEDFIYKLQAENKKLREALEMAIDSASFFQKFADCTKDSWSCRCEFCRDTSKTKNLTRAREALKEIGEL